MGIMLATPAARVGRAATLTLGNFPAPFVAGGDVSGTFIIGNSQAHLGIGAASTIDVVGGVALAGTLGDASPTGKKVLSGLLDIEAVDPAVTRITATGDFLTLGGRGSNAASRLVNSTLPVRQAGGLQDGTGKGIYDTESKVNYLRTANPDGSLDDYAFFSMSFDSTNNRYQYMAAGLSGFATRTMTQLIALNVAGQLPAPNTAGSVLTGTGVVVDLHDNAPADNKFETYQVVDGSGGAVVMLNPATIPGPAVIGKTFVLGNSQPHLCSLAAASTIDVVGAVPLAVSQARTTSGMVWSVLDIDAADTACTTITTSGDLLALGGRGGNAVTRIVNASLVIRQAGPVDGTGRGIFNANNGNNWQRTVVGTAVTDYNMDSTTTSGGRTVEVIAGLSGFATRSSSVLIANGAFGRGFMKGIVLELKDNNSDNVFDFVRLIDQTSATVYEFYDLFNVPFAQYWDYRMQYGEHPVGSTCFNQTSVNIGACDTGHPGPQDETVAKYPYSHWLPASLGNTQIGNTNTNNWIQAPMRMRVTGTDISGYTLASPVFLPVLSYQFAPGQRLDFTWDMNYLDNVQYTKESIGNGCSGLYTNDGYVLKSHITLTTDIQESKRLFGVDPTNASTNVKGARAWWTKNTNADCALQTGVETSLNNWFLAMGGDAFNYGKYDIGAAFEFYYYPFFTNVTAIVDNDGTTHVTIDHGAWGTEVLMSRFLYWGNTSYVGTAALSYMDGGWRDSSKARGWLGMESWWWEDFHFGGSVGASASNFNLRSNVDYLLTEWSRPGPDGFLDQRNDVPFWWFGSQLMDYVYTCGASCAQHRISELNRYSTTAGYVHSTPGSTQYNKTLAGYDYTPATWDLKVGDKWVIRLPNAQSPLSCPTCTAGQVVFHDPNLTPLGANPATQYVYTYHSVVWDGAGGAYPYEYWTPNTAPYTTLDATSNVVAVRGPMTTGGPPMTPTGGYPFWSYPTIGLSPGP